MRSALSRLSDALGVDRFDACVAVGAAMDLTAAVHLSREEIREMRASIS